MSVGQRWVVVFWSSKVLDKCFDQESCAIVFLAANFTALRLEQLGPPNAGRNPTRARLHSARTRRVAPVITRPAGRRDR